MPQTVPQTSVTSDTGAPSTSPASSSGKATARSATGPGDRFELPYQSIFMVTAPLLTVGIPVDLPKVKASALTDQKDPLEITVKLGGEIYLGESKVEVENLIPRLNAITELNKEARIYVRGDRVVAYGRIMEIMSLVNSAGYIKVALVTQNPTEN